MPAPHDPLSKGSDSRTWDNPVSPTGTITGGPYSWVLPALVMAAAFFAVGVCTDWFVGASRTPVVASLIPLIVGLLGAVTYGLIDKKPSPEKLLEGVKELKVEGSQAMEALRMLQPAPGGKEKTTSYWAPALWSLGAVIFCGGSVLGTIWGISYRVPVYRPLEELVKLPAAPNVAPPDPPLYGEAPPVLRRRDLGPEPPGDASKKSEPGNRAPAPNTSPRSLTAEEWAALHELRWTLQANGVLFADVEDFFQHCVVPLIASPNRAPMAVPGVSRSRGTKPEEIGIAASPSASARTHVA